MAADESHDDKTQSFIALTSGTSVLHYKILEKIGSGGMGEVYLALDTKLNRKVALKFLPPHLCQEEDCRKRFTREAQAAASLDHPNIAAIHEVGEFQGRPFYAMQIVEGQSLKDVIAGKDLPIDRILEIGIQVCEGLQAAHDKGIIHRDIKPSNILLDGHGRVRVVDFGLAAIRGSEHLTKTGSTLGTIGYMSPEQVQGIEIDQRSDLFSLGVVLYELITKQSPFKRDSEAATLKAVSDDLPEPLARFKSGIPEGLQSIVEKALEKDVRTRYQHADGMQSDLMRVKRSMESGQVAVDGRVMAKSSSRVRWIVLAMIVIAAMISLITVKPWQTEIISEKPERIMIAVLPFENLGDPDDEYFADGITHEITSRLFKFSGLGVIAPSSAAKYKNSEKGLKEIAHELGVRFLLEGTIRWDKSGGSSRVRITPRLIEASNNALLWAENYEQGIDAVFEVQIDIATQIVSALNITLLRPEKEAIESGQTANRNAYQAYLRGLDYLNRPDYLEGDFRMAVEMFQRATELDSTYALAYARLTYAHLSLYHQGMDRTDSRRQLAKQAVDRALELEPELGEAHLALGYYYYWGHRNYDKALDCFSNAERILPSNAEVALGIAAVHRRLGNFAEAVEWGKKAFQLSPRDASNAWEIGFTLRWLRRYEEAMYYIDLSIAVAPDQASAFELKRDIYLAWQGNIDSARIAQEQIPTSGEGLIVLSWYELKMLERDYRSAIDYLSKYEDTILYGQTEFTPVTLIKGLAYRNMEILDTARLMFDSARVLLDRKSEEDPNDYRYHQALATAYAGLGMSDSAIKQIEWALELFPLTRDAFFGTKLIEEEARVYCMLGKFERAIDRLDYLLLIPSGVSVALLKIDPKWDSLRDHPRFQALLEKYGGDQADI